LEVLGNTGGVRETDSGHVLARPGVVYAIRLRNFGPLRCVAAVEIDGKPVTAGGLVLDAYGVCTLERPVDADERGRFTVVAEGNERVFGPDGGRENDDLGLIEATFKRELPDARRPRRSSHEVPTISSFPMPTLARPLGPPRPRPMAPPEWMPPALGSLESPSGPDVSALMRSVAEPSRRDARRIAESIERAAGTGLTGQSDQEFVPAVIGTLEREATTLRLRLVIGTEEAIAEPRPLRDPEDAPGRPAARP
jgi:hypothetical protein